MSYLAEKCGEFVDTLRQVYQEFRDAGTQKHFIPYESAGSRVFVEVGPNSTPSGIAKRVNGGRMPIQQYATLNTRINE